MRYLPLSENDRSAMLEKIGAGSVDELFRDVPDGLLLKDPIEGLPHHASEMAVERELTAMAKKNMVAQRFLRMVGDTDGGHVTFDANPFMFLGEIEAHLRLPVCDDSDGGRMASV